MFGSVREIFRKLRRILARSRYDHASPPKDRAYGIEVRKLEREIGHRVVHPDLFIEALFHRSYLQFTSDPLQKSNERLEFLGDSILNFVVGEHLFHVFPNAEEGALTRIRSRLVNRKALANYARDIHLNDFLLMSSSAAQSLEKGSESILVDAYEALIAAIYLDKGFTAAKQFIERKILRDVDREFFESSDENYKSMLLEYSQANNLGIPRYNIVKEEGPDHDRTFTVEVLVESERYGIGVGKNKKDAEQRAACGALDRLQRVAVRQDT
jgi:ribonuclease-3